MAIRDHQVATVRVPPDLHSTLTREAAINGRSLSQEIVYRLRASVEQPDLAARLARVRRLEVEAATHRTGEPTPKGSPVPTLGEPQRELLSLFGTLSTEKQLALLLFLRRD